MGSTVTDRRPQGAIPAQGRPAPDRSGTRAVPQVAAYDHNERVWNPPMPLLFQYDRSGEISAMNGDFLRKRLNDVLAPA